MPAVLVSMQGMTTSTRCAAGMPLARAKRGSKLGRADSLMRRLTNATTASDVGSASSKPAKIHHTGWSASPVCRANKAYMSGTVASSSTPR